MSRRQRSQKISKMMPRSRALYNFMREDWNDFADICNRRWGHVEADLLPSSFSKGMLLGSGYFGIVIGTKSKKLVVKITSDVDEGYFNQIVLNDTYLQTSPGLPYIFDCFHIPEWDAHVILRENVKYGIDRLPESSPLTRSIPILDKFGESAMKIENRVAQIMKSFQNLNGNITRSDFSYAFREAQGQTRTEIIKALKTLPSVSEKSKYFYAMDVITYSLDKYGIALWDLHEMNLGRHQYDMSDLAESAPPLDKDCILILDVGGNFGSPIMAQMIDDLPL